MTSTKTPYHGRTHLPWGSDPIVGLTTDLTEVSPAWGRIIRDGSAGTLAIVSGSLTATTTLVDHNVVDTEDGVDCDIVSSPTRITIETDGLYLIHTEIHDADSGAGDYGVCVGVGFNSSSAIWSPRTAVRRVVNGLGIIEAVYAATLNATDYVTQVVGQNSGSTKTFTNLASLTVIRVPGRITTATDLGTIDGGSP